MTTKPPQPIASGTAPKSIIEVKTPTTVVIPQPILTPNKAAKKIVATEADSYGALLAKVTAAWIQKSKKTKEDAGAFVKSIVGMSATQDPEIVAGIFSKLPRDLIEEIVTAFDLGRKSHHFFNMPVENREVFKHICNAMSFAYLPEFEADNFSGENLRMEELRRRVTSCFRHALLQQGITQEQDAEERNAAHDWSRMGLCPTDIMETIGAFKLEALGAGAELPSHQTVREEFSHSILVPATKLEVKVFTASAIEMAGYYDIDLFDMATAFCTKAMADLHIKRPDESVRRELGVVADLHPLLSGLEVATGIFKYMVSSEPMQEGDSLLHYAQAAVEKSGNPKKARANLPRVFGLECTGVKLNKDERCNLNQGIENPKGYRVQTARVILTKQLKVLSEIQAGVEVDTCMQGHGPYVSSRYTGEDARRVKSVLDKRHHQR